jgi:hypothetical protein
MKVVIVFEFEGINDADSPEADLIIEEIGTDCEGMRLDTGATSVYIEEVFSEGGAYRQSGDPKFPQNKS